MVTCAVLWGIFVSQPVPGVPGLQDKPTAPPAESALVELRGVLRPQADRGFSVSVKGLVFELGFDAASNTERVAKVFAGKAVVVKGALEAGKAGDKSPAFVVKVTTLTPDDGGKVDAAKDLVDQLKQTSEALVGYKVGRSDEAIALCKALGLEVVEVYGGGQLLLCRWSDKVDVKAAVAKLKESRAVEYVVPNVGVKIDPPVKKP